MSNSKDLEMILNIPVGISAEVGSTHLTVREVLSWVPEAVVPLDNYTDEPLSICINDIPMATGEAVEIEDHYGIRIIEVASTKERVHSLA